MIAVWILTGLILLLFALLCCPVRIRLDYTDSLSVTIRFLFLKFRITPPEKEKTEKEKKPKKKKAKKSAESGEKKEKKNFFKTLREEEGFSGALHFLYELAKIIKSAVARTASHLIIRLLDVRLIVASSDAAQTAMLYGETCSAVFPLLSCICSCAKVRRYNADIRPDFLASKPSAEIAVEVSLRPIFVVHAGLGGLYGYIKNIVLAKKQSKQGGAENER